MTDCGPLVDLEKSPDCQQLDDQFDAEGELDSNSLFNYKTFRPINSTTFWFSDKIPTGIVEKYQRLNPVKNK